MTWTKEMPANPVVAVAGATGAVGQEFLRVLHDVDFPASEVRALASARSAGKKVPFEGCGLVPAGELTVQEMTPESFEGVDIALFSAGASVSKEMREAVTAAGAVMIDNSSAFRMDEDVPLVVPEVNPQDVAWHNGVIANPNCSTIQMVVALKPLYDLSPIKRVVVSTYQAASGAGGAAGKCLGIVPLVVFRHVGRRDEDGRFAHNAEFRQGTRSRTGDHGIRSCKGDVHLGDKGKQRHPGGIMFVRMRLDKPIEHLAVTGVVHPAALPEELRAVFQENI